MKLSDEQIRSMIFPCDPNGGLQLVEHRLDYWNAMCREVLAARKMRDAEESYNELNAAEDSESVAWRRWQDAQEAYDKAREGIE